MLEQSKQLKKTGMTMSMISKTLKVMAEVKLTCVSI